MLGAGRREAVGRKRDKNFFLKLNKYNVTVFSGRKNSLNLKALELTRDCTQKPPTPLISWSGDSGVTRRTERPPGWTKEV